MNPLAIFAGPYALFAKWGVIAALCLALFGFGWVKGNDHGTRKLLDYQGAQAVASAKLIVKQGQTTERVVNHYIKVKGETQTVTQTVEKEVVRYVAQNPAGLCLDAQWRVLHDRAATNAVPESAGGTHGESGTSATPTAGRGSADSGAGAGNGDAELPSGAPHG